MVTIAMHACDAEGAFHAQLEYFHAVFVHRSQSNLQRWQRMLCHKARATSLLASSTRGSTCIIC